MVVLCCIVVVTGFLPSPVSRSSLSSPPSQVCVWCDQIPVPPLPKMIFGQHQDSFVPFCSQWPITFCDKIEPYLFREAPGPDIACYKKGKLEKKYQVPSRILLSEDFLLVVVWWPSNLHAIHPLQVIGKGWESSTKNHVNSALKGGIFLPTISLNVEGKGTGIGNLVLDLVLTQKPWV